MSGFLLGVLLGVILGVCLAGWYWAILRVWNDQQAVDRVIRESRLLTPTEE